MADDIPDDAPVPLPEYDPDLYDPKFQRCPMECCSNIILDDDQSVVHPLEWWLERESTKQRAATLRTMLIPLGVTATRGVPRYTCAHLDDTDPNDKRCRAYKQQPDFCANTPTTSCGGCFTCGLADPIDTLGDHRSKKPRFVKPLPAVNTQHIEGNLPIGLLPDDEQRLAER